MGFMDKMRNRFKMGKGHAKPADNDLQMPNASPSGPRLNSTTCDPSGEDPSSRA